MNKLILISALILTGCASQQQMDYKRINDEAENSRLNAASRNAIVSCPTRPACEQAFALARLYVLQSADMKVQLSTDTLVSTYNPLTEGKIGLTALMVPNSDGSGRIQLRYACEGYFSCIKGVTAILEGFPSFVQP